MKRKEMLRFASTASQATKERLGINQPAPRADPVHLPKERVYGDLLAHPLLQTLEAPPGFKWTAVPRVPRNASVIRHAALERALHAKLAPAAAGVELTESEFAALVPPMEVARGACVQVGGTWLQTPKSKVDEVYECLVAMASIVRSSSGVLARAAAPIARCPNPDHDFEHWMRVAAAPEGVHVVRNPELAQRVAGGEPLSMREVSAFRLCATRRNVAVCAPSGAWYVPDAGRATRPAMSQDYTNGVMVCECGATTRYQHDGDPYRRFDDKEDRTHWSALADKAAREFPEVDEYARHICGGAPTRAHVERAVQFVQLYARANNPVRRPVFAAALLLSECPDMIDRQALVAPSAPPAAATGDAPPHQARCAVCDAPCHSQAAARLHCKSAWGMVRWRVNRCAPAPPLGWAWRDVGDERPVGGLELRSAELSEALVRPRVHLDEAAWHALQRQREGAPVRDEHFIRAASGRYFRPVAPRLREAEDAPPALRAALLRRTREGPSTLGLLAPFSRREWEAMGSPAIAEGTYVKDRDETGALYFVPVWGTGQRARARMQVL